MQHAGRLVVDWDSVTRSRQVLGEGKEGQKHVGLGWLGPGDAQRGHGLPLLGHVLVSRWWEVQLWYRLPSIGR
jgi:hypothetical protein